ncbi:MFS general substrate transporter [Wolfiporia cocos MD-104 SS10]|uniref:MFS general substrate transporter n=1 Tax=Wolfiporia cocos (strain MD-104) TaxID=742152 RepID=A0A2H3J1H6_WOLCO|nr:MFS general substrate transporter [Wolfiporia cocos MD-104 SS10]
MTSLPRDEVELSLLAHAERLESEEDLSVLPQDDLEEELKPHMKTPLSSREKRAIFLLTALFLSQGLPVVLATGSLPFLLRKNLSYSQLAIFSLSSYPYSMKLLWSPIVDSVSMPSIGRRKSWILPLQLMLGIVLLVLSFSINELMEEPAEHLYALTATFTLIIIMAATQVALTRLLIGWALKLLHESNRSYLSTCQSIGFTTGFLLSFTVFMALNSADFAQRWGIPQLTLRTYMRFCCAVSLSLVVWLLLEKEEKEDANENVNIKSVYLTMWEICKLKHVQSLLLLHLFAFIGFQADSDVTSLKLVEKGLTQEFLSISVLIGFPFQILGSYLAGRWARGNKPLKAWMLAFWPRLAMAGAGALIVWLFPGQPIPAVFLCAIVAQGMLSTFAMTIQFGGMISFHSRISDPLVGGTYMTLFATFNNLGTTWPKFFVLRGVDMFTIAACNVQHTTLTKPIECVSQQGKAACTQSGGECVIERDGYYIISGICLALGVLSVIFHMIPTARRLQVIPAEKWRVSSG